MRAGKVVALAGVLATALSTKAAAFVGKDANKEVAYLNKIANSGVSRSLERDMFFTSNQLTDVGKKLLPKSVKPQAVEELMPKVTSPMQNAKLTGDGKIPEKYKQEVGVLTPYLKLISKDPVNGSDLANYTKNITRKTMEDGTNLYLYKFNSPSYIHKVKGFEKLDVSGAREVQIAYIVDSSAAKGTPPCKTLVKVVYEPYKSKDGGKVYIIKFCGDEAEDLTIRRINYENVGYYRYTTGSGDGIEQKFYANSDREPDLTKKTSQWKLVNNVRVKEISQEEYDESLWEIDKLSEIQGYSVFDRTEEEAASAVAANPTFGLN